MIVILVNDELLIKHRQEIEYSLWAEKNKYPFIWDIKFDGCKDRGLAVYDGR